ncbi:MAG: radical SAM protein [Clostridiales Family XIII bacterium]|jgi:radical SAM protein with 4Fe4S-binding SPASM domain|nr:radical SAM protein [Clostridiales Family XIII bacterium]
MGNLLIRHYEKSNYVIFFDRNNGTFCRFGKNDIDPFFNITGPELLDIAITNYCEKECGFCYRRSSRLGKFMPLDDYKHVMEEASKVGVLQVALGGGNPNQHPQFTQILEITRKHDIMPSYTTNGQGMTDEIYAATKKLCGAMAVSWYEPYIEAETVIKQAGIHKITVNIHFLLSKNSLTQAIHLLETRNDILENVNAIIFLNYKPIHSPESLCLSDGDEIKYFFELVKKIKICKIGFDSCMVSYLPLMGEDLVLETVDFCEAGRFSAYISEELLFYPCSFLNDISKNGISLKTTSLEDAWTNGEEFVSVRKKLNSPGMQNFPISKCHNCQSYALCHGGCQILDINRCRI